MGIRHTVLMVTYNHEKYISIALDSLLYNQNVLPDEIIISDDCSEDHTWQIITSYSQKFSQIKANRNKLNIGINENLNSVKKYITGDVVSYVAGDDLIKPNLFEHFNKAIINNNIDVKKDRFIIITNSVHLHLNGRETIYNNYQLNGTNLLKARLRYGLSFRTVGIGVNTLNACNSFREDIGVFSDWLLGFEKLINTDKFVFLDISGAVYRLRVGITSRTKSIDFAESQKKVLDLILSRYWEKFDKRDILYTNFIYAHIKFIKSSNIVTYLELFYWYIRNLNNFHVNNPWYKNSAYLLPKWVVSIINKARKQL